ncbi:hypothetical protein BOX15_Mlig030368g1 [Macrostomum lignano]|uniref:Dedicator of cytokinesis protein 7 n=2 Tax=Macrostomum lignano TaxID=282301 RepID=A0A267GJP2_9PLAT|nr:hypothetical protein BOX15_Mlig030368g1 [Macrostomum lignano]
MVDDFLRRGSSQENSKRASITSDDLDRAFDNLKCISLTVKSFFKQEQDKISEEDLFKYLNDLRRPSSVLKKLKNIGGKMVLNLQTCPYDLDLKCALTPELLKVHPFCDLKSAPIRELAEFPAQPLYQPHSFYRNLLYVHPKSINFSSKQGSARNVALKTELVHFDGQRAVAQRLIYGKSSCPAFVTSQFSPVLYHNKSPDFYDEIKIELPGDLSSGHYLLFSFFHISCQQRKGGEDNGQLETPLGYSWLPLYRSGVLSLGNYSLMVSADEPSTSMCSIVPELGEVADKCPSDRPRWVDSHRELFRVTVSSLSTVHTIDTHLNLFFKACVCAQLGQPCSTEALQDAINGLMLADMEQLVQLLHIVIDRLMQLVLHPAQVPSDRPSQIPFAGLARLIGRIVQTFPERSDIHGRNSLLTGYIKYAGTLGQQGGLLKLVHEELVLQIILAEPTVRASVAENAWFFLETLIRAMHDYLAVEPHLSLPRQRRFSQQFVADVGTLVTLLTRSVLVADRTAIRLNRALAFFLCDLFSVMDRLAVLQLVQQYFRAVNACLEAAPTGTNHGKLSACKIDFLRIITSHEHYVPLNIPLMEPEIASELSDQYRRSHYLSGLVLSELKIALRCGGPDLQSKAVCLLWNLLASHEADSRYPASLPAIRGRVAQLYLPLLKIAEGVIHLIGIGIGGFATHGGGVSANGGLAGISDLATPATPADDIGRFGFPEPSTEKQQLLQAPKPKQRPLSDDTSRHLLLCCLWLVKNLDRRVAATFLRSLSVHRVQRLLHLLMVACASFEYRGRQPNSRQSNGSSLLMQQRSAQVKLKLEEKFLGSAGDSADAALSQQQQQPPPPPPPGSGSNRRKSIGSILTMPHSQSENALAAAAANNNASLAMAGQQSAAASANSSSSNRLRLAAARKEAAATIAAANSSVPPPPPLISPPPPPPPTLPVNAQLNSARLHYDPVLEGNLSLEVTLTALDTAELIMTTFQGTETLACHLGLILRLYLRCLSLSQCSTALHSVFASLRSFLMKYPETVFEEEADQCTSLCLQLLRYCGSRLTEVRTQATATLYLLMRINYTRKFHFSKVKMQLTMALSSFVSDREMFNEDYLRRSLKALLSYTDRDEAVCENFSGQVQDLVLNLHTILSDTIKMKEFAEDPEMLVDLMYRVAKGYANSPDLRLTWLQNMARQHLTHKHYAEAGMCLLHSVSLVVEYLHMMDPVQYMPVGCAAFSAISKNVLEESAVSDDVISPEEDGVCCSNWFLRPELLALVDHSAQFFELSGLYEFIEPLYTALLPLHRHNKDYRRLAAVYAKMRDSCDNIAFNESKRMFGTYFRVGFYGHRFGDLDGEEFVYKEPPLTKLPEISHRLERFYGDRFGPDNLVIVKDSNAVERERLDQNKAYIQITYVEPYLEPYELRERQSQFERNNGIATFVYSTPYTQSGRAHGDLQDQCKRKTVLTTSHSFPYIKTRLQVIHTKSFNLTPIEVAIEDLEKKNAELTRALELNPPDLKILQMVLQGSIGATVNQGPVEMASVFLASVAEGTQPAAPAHHKLRLAFKEFLLKSHDALAKNRDLIMSDQVDYQTEMEKNYQLIKDQLLPLTSWGNPSFDREQRNVVAARRKSNSSMSSC